MAASGVKPLSEPMLTKFQKHHASSYWVNSLRPSDAYMRQYNIPALPQIMACRLFVAKLFTEPMLPYCQLNHKEHISVKFPKFKFSFKKTQLKMSAKWQQFWDQGLLQYKVYVQNLDYRALRRFLRQFGNWNGGSGWTKVLVQVGNWTDILYFNKPHTYSQWDCMSLLPSIRASMMGANSFMHVDKRAESHPPRPAK